MEEPTRGRRSPVQVLQLRWRAIRGREDTVINWEPQPLFAFCWLVDFVLCFFISTSIICVLFLVKSWAVWFEPSQVELSLSGNWQKSAIYPFAAQTSHTSPAVSCGNELWRVGWLYPVMYCTKGVTKSSQRCLLIADGAVMSFLLKGRRYGGDCSSHPYISGL